MSSARGTGRKRAGNKLPVSPRPARAKQPLGLKLKTPTTGDVRGVIVHAVAAAGNADRVSAARVVRRVSSWGQRCWGASMQLGRACGQSRGSHFPFFNLQAGIKVGDVVLYLNNRPTRTLAEFASIADQVCPSAVDY